MTDSQEESLVAAMAQERQNFKFTTDLNGGSGAKALDMFAGMTDEKIDQYTAELEQLNQNYIAQAQTILTPAPVDPPTKSSSRINRLSPRPVCNSPVRCSGSKGFTE